MLLFSSFSKINISRNGAKSIKDASVIIWGKPSKVVCNLSTSSSSCNKSVKIRLVANLSFADLLPVVETTCSKPVDNRICNQLATCLLTACNRFVVDNNLSQAMRMHPDIDLLIKSIVRCQQTCSQIKRVQPRISEANLGLCSKIAQ